VVVVVEVSNDLVKECHLVPQRWKVGDRSLAASDVHREVQLIRWGKRVRQRGERRQAEAYHPGDGLQGKPREGAVAVVVYHKELAADKVAVG
jgi:hypothetical protein